MPWRPHTSWQLRTRTLGLGGSTRVMGILNCTPDSFSEGLLSQAPMSAPQESAGERIERGLALLDEGADILDIGGESTRPGSHAATADAVPPEQEQRRILPVIRGILSARPEATLSVDTYRASTARLAVEAGCEIVNDPSGLLWDAGMAAAVAELGCGLVMNHTRGKPDEWKNLPPLAMDEVLPVVRAGLARQLETALAAGVAAERIVLDPGYGFGKAFEANYALLARQSELLELGRPLLVGVSRKSFLGRTLASLRADGSDAPADERERATSAAHAVAVLQGASLVRAHDVCAAREAAAVADAVCKQGLTLGLAT